MLFRSEQMAEAGVVGFLKKDSDIQEVYSAIESVVAGECILPEWVDAEAKSQTDPDALSERELSVLSAICQGLSTPQIAEQLSISRRTVDAHRARILEKTGCNNTASLVAYAVKMNLVEV